MSKVDRAARTSRRARADERPDVDAVERRERVVTGVEERRKGGGGRRREDREAARAQSRPDRPFAPLVAQLIATSIGAPQTRPRRRAAVQDAISAYEKAAAPATSKVGSSA